MTGNITRRGKDSWRLKYDVPTSDGGRDTRYRTVRGTKRTAQKELTRILHEIDTSRYIEPTSDTVADYLRRWIKDGAAQTTSLKTRERYTEIVELHWIPALGKRALKDLSPLDIQGALTDMLANGRRDGGGGLAARTVIHHYRILSSALKQAVKWRLLAHNPAEAVTPPRPEDTERAIFIDSELAVLLNAAQGARSYAPILLAATTGLRRGEVLGVRWRDIDLDSGKLTVAQTLEETKGGLRIKPPKTKRSRRTIPLTAVTIDVLKTHRQAQAEERVMLGLGRDDAGLVFTDLEGGPRRPRNFSKEFTRIVKRAGLPPVSFHGLRHGHVTMLLSKGINPKVVSERAGHASVAITLQLYGHVLPDMQESAIAEIDKQFQMVSGANPVPIPVSFQDASVLRH